MKKLSIIMATVATFVCLLCVNASAATTKTTVSVNVPAEVQQGAEVSVAVDFSENTGFNTLGVKLTYPEGFTYVADSAVASSLIAEKFYLDFAGFSGETYVFYHDETARTITFVGASLYDIEDASGSLFSAKFKAPDTVAEGIAFTVEVVDTAYNEVGDTVTVTKNNGSLDVIEVSYILGDVDGNGLVQTADAMLALNAATKRITLTDKQLLAANVITTDGLTTADAIRILYHATKRITSF